jgi:thymidine phosphorylase
MQCIVRDIAAGRYSDLHLAAFVTACAGGRLGYEELVALTRAMVAAGERLNWARSPILDKHSVGGLPGNRTSPIVVAIVAACGLTIPKTSSRAITSPAGTADVMETLAPVDLDLAAMRRVVEREGGCIVWGGAMRLSPADDVLIRVARPLDFDSEAQLVASVLSKKAAAGSTHVLVDIPVGPTAKVRSEAAGEALGGVLTRVGEAVGVEVKPVLSDGSQPVGRGIGPALEARDVLAVLRGAGDAPADLRERALWLAAAVLDMAPHGRLVPSRQSASLALESGAALKKFEAICRAQGALREPPVAPITHVVTAAAAGTVAAIDNRRLARLAKLSGAPAAQAAGVELHVRVGSRVEQDQPLLTLHTQTPGERDYALGYLARHPDMIAVAEAM